MSKCKCRSPPHSIYVRSSIDKFTGFNKPALDRATKLITQWGAEPYRAWIMDAGSLGTSHVFVDGGIPAKNITAFTYCRVDHEMMGHDSLNVEKVHATRAEVCNQSEKFDDRNIIFIDDGMQYACNVLPDIDKLLQSQPRHLGLMCNIVPRDKKLSHRTFINDVKAAARKYGLVTIVAEKLDTYPTGPGIKMFPFWFEIKKP